MNELLLVSADRGTDLRKYRVEVRLARVGAGRRETGPASAASPAA